MSEQSAEKGLPALTAQELAEALDAAPNDDYDWPYISTETDTIDGLLMPVCEWLVERYDIRPRAGVER